MQLYRQPPPPEHLNDTLVPGIVAEGVVLLVVPTVAVLLRFWARFVKPEVKLWWDDWFIVVTLVFSNTLLALFLANVQFGLGKHIETIQPLTKITTFLKNVFAAAIMYLFVQWAYKMTTILLYLRVFGGHRRFSIISLSLAAFVTVVTVVQILLYAFFVCVPTAKNWDPMLPGTCRSLNKFFYGSQSVGAILDVVILLLPLPMIKGLNLDKRQKIYVALIFLLGYCVVIVPLVRTGLIAKYAWVFSTTEDPDPTWNTVILDYIIVIDGPIAILGLSLPPIFQLYRRAHSHGMKSLTNSRTYGSALSNSDDRKVEKDTKLRSIRSSGEMRSRLVNSYGGGGSDSADEIAMNNILQRKDLSVMESTRQPGDDRRSWHDGNSPPSRSAFPAEEV
ncbi:MAG: hypothetical protein M1828_005003 [Chrysothrix sp. TS-e1954]|nr:MAG: hypothetical protein M1828_005003 [Chrysothrix sp. TS-e1954]